MWMNTHPRLPPCGWFIRPFRFTETLVIIGCLTQDEFGDGNPLSSSTVTPMHGSGLWLEIYFKIFNGLRSLRTGSSGESSNLLLYAYMPSDRGLNRSPLRMIMGVHFWLSRGSYPNMTYAPWGLN